MTSLLREQLHDPHSDCTSSLLHRLLLMWKLLVASCYNNRRRSRLFFSLKTLEPFFRSRNSCSVPYTAARIGVVEVYILVVLRRGLYYGRWYSNEALSLYSLDAQLKGGRSDYVA